MRGWLIKFVIVAAIEAFVCRQCEEDFVGFRKLGVHRKTIEVQGHFRF